MTDGDIVFVTESEVGQMRCMDCVDTGPAVHIDLINARSVTHVLHTVADRGEVVGFRTTLVAHPLLCKTAICYDNLAEYSFAFFRVRRCSIINRRSSAFEGQSSPDFFLGFVPGPQ